LPDGLEFLGPEGVVGVDDNGHVRLPRLVPPSLRMLTNPANTL